MANIFAIHRRPLPKDREDSAKMDSLILPELPNPSETAAEILALFCDLSDDAPEASPTLH